MKTLLVTGASAGFGWAIARKFSTSGFRVIAVARRKDKLEELKKECGENLIPCVCDVSNQNEVEGLRLRLRGGVKSTLDSSVNAPANSPLETALDTPLDRIDILVNNAGFALGMDPAHKAQIDDWNAMVDTNIKGLLYLTHSVLPGMVKRNSGHIINLGSVAGEFPYPFGNVYGATKAFVHQFSLNLRADLLGLKVRVTCIEPGMCSGTEFSNIRFRGDSQKATQVYQGVEALTPEDIAETVYWISQRPPHVNINTISMMPVQQAFGPLAVSRES